MTHFRWFFTGSLCAVCFLGLNCSSPGTNSGTDSGNQDTTISTAVTTETSTDTVIAPETSTDTATTDANPSCTGNVRCIDEQILGLSLFDTVSTGAITEEGTMPGNFRTLIDARA